MDGSKPGFHTYLIPIPLGGNRWEWNVGQTKTGISRTQDPASRDEKNWVGTHGFVKRRFHGRKVFSP